MLARSIQPSGYIPASKNIVESLVSQARAARGSASFIESADLYRSATKLLSSSNRVAAAKLAVEFASLLIDLGLHAEAKSVLDAFEDVYQTCQALSKFRLEYLAVQSAILFWQNKFQEAETNLRKAIFTATHLGEIDSDSVALLELQLCLALSNQGKNPDESEMLCLRILADAAKTDLCDHSGLMTLSEIMLSQEKLELAEKLGKAGLDKAPAISLDAAWNLTLLGQIYNKLNRHTEAIDVLRSSLSVLEKCVGSSHSLYGNVALTLAQILIHENEYVEATQLLEKARAIFQNNGDTQNAELSLSYLNLCQQKM